MPPLNPDPANSAVVTETNTALNPASGTRVLPDSMVGVALNPAAPIHTTDRVVTGVDVTQPPALDIETGLAVTTLSEASKTA